MTQHQDVRASQGGECTPFPKQANGSLKNNLLTQEKHDYRLDLTQGSAIRHSWVVPQLPQTENKQIHGEDSPPQRADGPRTQVF